MFFWELKFDVFCYSFAGITYFTDRFFEGLEVKLIIISNLLSQWKSSQFKFARTLLT